MALIVDVTQAPATEQEWQHRQRHAAAASMLHDAKNSLTVIKGTTFHLLDQADRGVLSASELSNRLGRINAAAARLIEELDSLERLV